MLQEVLRDANDASKPLDNVLRTAMVFAYSLNYQPLIDWVNAELDGYPNNENLPDYRWFRSEVHANFSNGFWQRQNERVSDYAFPEEWRDIVTRVELLVGVRNLEENIDRTDAVQYLPSFVVSYLTQKASQGYQCQNAWHAIPPGAVAQVLSAIGTRLMRFCLTIKKEFPNLAKDESLGANHTVPIPAIAYYFNTIVLGENASVGIGDVDITSQVNNVQAGDFDSLRDALIRNGVVESDIESLREMIGELSAEDVSQDPAAKSRLREWSASTGQKIGRTVGGDVRGIIVEMVLRMILAYYGITRPLV
jgi:hypothetical protein